MLDHEGEGGERTSPLQVGPEIVAEDQSPPRQPHRVGRAGGCGKIVVQMTNNCGLRTVSESPSPLEAGQNWDLSRDVLTESLQRFPHCPGP